MSTTNPSDIVRLFNQSYITIDDSDAALKLLSFLATQGNLQILDINRTEDGSTQPHVDFINHTMDLTSIPRTEHSSRKGAEITDGINGIKSVTSPKSQILPKRQHNQGVSTISVNPHKVNKEQEEILMEHNNEISHNFTTGQEVNDIQDDYANVSSSIVEVSPTISFATMNKTPNTRFSNSSTIGHDEPCPLTHIDLSSQTNTGQMDSVCKQRVDSVIKCPRNIHNCYKTNSSNPVETKCSSYDKEYTFFSVEEAGHNAKIYDRSQVDRTPIM